ncbi:restriction endonuclease subunit S [Bacillus safensis]|uniref:restriction endonuclease subunit S n=1 Tax=Bacillus safensis TaxID=561879 RepID=UPI00349E7819
MGASLNKKLEKVKWGEYKIGDLFEVLSSKKRFDANKVQVLKSGDYPYVVRMSSNNGQKGFINEDEKFLNEGNTISFGQDTATMFYQENPYFTGDKIKILKAKDKRFNKKNAQFFLSTMMKSFSSFSWGSSSFNVNIIEKQKITLPILKNEIDFDFMESFIAELETERVGELESYLTATGLKNYELTEEEKRAIRSFNKVEWKKYQMKYLFERINTKKLPYKAKELPKEPTGKYILPCLTSSFMNQGLNYFAPKENATILENVISIPSNSDVYRAYFQSREFTVLSDAYAIKWIYDDRELSKNQYLFTVPCINEVTDLPKYSYKNKLGGWNVVRNKFISLPIKNNKPDYEFMETLISAIQKLVIKDVVLCTNRKIDSAKCIVNKNSIEEIKKP